MQYNTPLGGLSIVFALNFLTLLKIRFCWLWLALLSKESGSGDAWSEMAGASKHAVFAAPQGGLDFVAEAGIPGSFGFFGPTFAQEGKQLALILGGEQL